MSARRIATVALFALTVVPPARSQAQPTEPGVSESAAEVPVHVQRARALYLEGVRHVEQARWGDALAAFQGSLAAHPHATTLFNIASCERALARYTAAWLSFRRTLERAEAYPDELSTVLRQEAQQRIDEALALFARVRVQFEPASASVAVDGAPLVRQRAVMVAGLAVPGPGEAVPGGRFELWLNPGAHVFLFERKGYEPIAVNRTFSPGRRTELRLELERMPATLRVQSNVLGAVVKVDGADVGLAPVEVRRPRGVYRVVVRKDGYEPYEARVRVNAGEETSLRATLQPEQVSLLQRWWFWVGAAAVVAGGAGFTYAVTRPEPDPPPYRTGTTGWLVTP